MLFQTWTFAIFFLAVFLIDLPLRRTRWRPAWLTAASYVFYAFWAPSWCILLAWATLSTFAVVLLMDRARWPRLWLWVSVLGNLGLLGAFKYARFAAESVNEVLGWCGVPDGLPMPGWAFPVGISFFTFHAISYTVDVLRGTIPRERNILRFAAYMALFPKLMMGPIERGGGLLPQLEEGAPFRASDVADGLSMFIVGLFKKVALADYLALYVNPVYASPGEFQAGALAAATFAYAWQIYFDFSGYTDMARGLARTLGLRLMLNFRNPYLAADLGEFWRRWHISLSTWFRDYVYIPLGGNRKGTVRTYVNMSVTMVVSGLWHGAAWTFVLWGAVHALGRVLTRALESTAFYRDTVPRAVKQLLVFAFVCLAWAFFRAQGIGDGWLIVSRIITSGWGSPAFPLLALTFVLAVWAYEYVYESRLRTLVQARPVRMGLCAAMILYLALFAGGGAEGFIYLQF